MLIQGMVNLPLPDYYKGYLIQPGEINDWPTEKFLTGYIIINGVLNSLI